MVFYPGCVRTFRKMPSQKFSGTSENPTDIMLKRGQAFGAWFRSAIQGAGLNINVLANKINTSKPLLYSYRDNCIGSDKRFRKPSEGMIRLIAEATNASVADGLRAMGYDGDAESLPAVPNQISSLGSDAQQQLARFLQLVKPVDLIYLPVVGKVGAGTAVANLESVIEKMGVLRTAAVADVPEDELFVLRVEGYCLSEAFIKDGDFLVCRRADHAQPGKIVVVYEHDEAIAKRLREGPNGKLWLETDDGKPTRVPVGPDARIFGVVVSRTGGVD